MTDRRDQPERPHSEPEIIPPDRDGWQADWRQAPWRATFYNDDDGTTQRVFAGRVGPFGVALLVLAIAAVVAVVAIAVLGVVLVWIPVIAVVVVAAGLLRHFRR